MGPGGNFLVQPSTRTASRSGEFYAPSLIGRSTTDAWIGLGRPTMYSRARERVRAILEAPATGALPDATVHDVDRILAEADRALAER